jgi:hypothetical protein
MFYCQQQWGKQVTAKRPVAAGRQKDHRDVRTNANQSKLLKTGKMPVKARTPAIAET